MSANPLIAQIVVRPPVTGRRVTPATTALGDSLVVVLGSRVGSATIVVLVGAATVVEVLLVVLVVLVVGGMVLLVVLVVGGIELVVVELVVIGAVVVVVGALIARVASSTIHPAWATRWARIVDDAKTASAGSGTMACARNDAPWTESRLL